MLLQQIATAVAMGAFVFVRAFQQRNVMGLKYSLVLPTSYVMAAFEIFVIYNIATIGPSVKFALMLGTATGLSCMASMYIHKRFVK